MKKLLFPCILIFTICINFSCKAPQIKNLKASGDEAEIIFNNQNMINAELITVNDSSIYVVVKPQNKHQGEMKNQLFEINLHDIKSLKIAGYSNKEWWKAVLAFEVVPTLIMGLTASSVGAKGGSVIAILSVPTLINILIFSASTPKEPGLKEPISAEQLNELRKYARFPQGLTSSQLNQFLGSIKQDTIMYLK